MNSKYFSGTALVVLRGKIILNQSYGLSIQGRQVANKTTTEYCIGSAQKSIIVTAILQFEQTGKLKIEDPVAKYRKGSPDG